MFPQDAQNLTPTCETPTGETWLGMPVFRQFFSGTTPTSGSTVDLTPQNTVAHVLKAAGWLSPSNVSSSGLWTLGDRVPVEFWMPGAASVRCFIVVRQDRKLQLRIDGADFGSRAFQLSVDYLKEHYPL